MSKLTFLVVMPTGDSHSVTAESFHASGGEVSLMSEGQLVAYFKGVTSVVLQPEEPAPVKTDGPNVVSVLGSVADFAIRPTVEIGALNITCGTADIAASVGQAMQALMGARERSTPD